MDCELFGLCHSIPAWRTLQHDGDPDPLFLGRVANWVKKTALLLLHVLRTVVIVEGIEGYNKTVDGRYFSGNHFG
jgi:hypothetical protein